MYSSNSNTLPLSRNAFFKLKHIASKTQCIIQTNTLPLSRNAFFRLKYIASELPCIHAQNIASDIRQQFANVIHDFSLQAAIHHQSLLYSPSKWLSKPIHTELRYLHRYQTPVSDISSASPTSLRHLRVCYISVTLCLSDKLWDISSIQ